MLRSNYGPLLSSPQSQLLLPASMTSYVGKGVTSENLKPFTESLQGAAEKSNAQIEGIEVLAQGNMDKFIVLGRNQDNRVDVFAKELSKLGLQVETITKDFPNGPGNPEVNMNWLRMKHAQGYSVIDIGLDPFYTKQGNMDEGKFYGAEKATNGSLYWPGRSSIPVKQPTKQP